MERLPGFPSTAPPNLPGLLRNLKILDFVVQIGAGPAVQEGRLRTLTGVIDEVWDRLVEPDPQTGPMRSVLLKKLAAHEANFLTRGTPEGRMDVVDPALLPFVSPLTQDGLIRRHGGRLTFAHDMLGDWARLKAIIEETPDPSALSPDRFAANIGWHTALRLYGQRLLEGSDGGISQWSWLLERLADGGTSTTILRDLLLESLIAATDAGRLAEAAWQVLTANEGRLLKLLLERFPHIASVPDTAVLAAVGERAEGWEHLHRVPNQPYWTGLLPVLLAHQAEVLQLAPAATARLLRLWFEKADRRGRDFRSLDSFAADLAIGLARELQGQAADGHRELDESERIDAYVALLYSTRQRPDDAAQIALELAKRREVPPHAKARRDAARARRQAWRRSVTDASGEIIDFSQLLSDSSTTEDEVPVEPPPDAPRSRVDDAFAQACFHRYAAIRLAVFRPAVFSEVLLAVLIEPPSRCRWNDNPLDRSYGLADHFFLRSALPTVGPFLDTLRVGGDAAIRVLDLAIRLTNLATDRWQVRDEAQRQRWAAEPFPFPFPAPRGPFAVRVGYAPDRKRFVGDHQVFAWCRGIAPPSHALASLLMALEQWLYERADGGLPIEEAVWRIFRYGRSAALLGVLVQVAKRFPRLLRGPLLPLVSMADAFALDLHSTLELASLPFWRSDRLFYGEPWAAMSEAWHSLPHRNIRLIDVALTLAREAQVVYHAVDVNYRGWEDLAGATDDEGAELWINHFGDLVYWRRAEREGTVERRELGSWMRRRQQDRNEVALATNPSVRPGLVAYDARDRLENGTPLAGEDLEPYWQVLQAQSGLPETDEPGTQPIDAVIGGVAVLMTLHCDWLRSVPERERWCREQLQALADRDPRGGIWDCEETPGSATWDAFAGECGLILLAEDPADVLGRDLTLFGLTAHRYAAVEATAQKMFEVRDPLGPLFGRLVNFIRRWAAIREVIAVARRFRLDASPVLGERIRSLLADTWGGGITDVRETLAQIERRGHADLLQVLEEGRRSRPDPRDEGPVEIQPGDVPPIPPRVRIETWTGMDVDHLRAGFAWLQGAATARPLDPSIIPCLEEFLQLSIDLNARRRGEDRSRSLDQFDLNVQWWVALALPRLDAELAGRLWKPILDQPRVGNRWIESFLSSWFTVASDRGIDPAEFVAIWIAMIRSVRASSSDGGGNTDGAGAGPALLGGRKIIASIGQDSRYRRPIESVSRELDGPAPRWLTSPDVAEAFCRFVATPVGSALLPRALLWLSTASVAWHDNHSTESLGRQLAQVLTLTRRRFSDLLSQDANLRAQFQQLISVLIASGHPAGLTLRDSFATPD